jgi:hypothetical protein
VPIPNFATACGTLKANFAENCAPRTACPEGQSFKLKRLQL